MTSSRIEYLFHGYLNQELSFNEHQELMQLLLQPTNESAIKSLLDGVWNNLAVEDRLSLSKADELFNVIVASDRVEQEVVIQRPVRRLFSLTRIAVAAVMLLCISAGVWYFFLKRSAPAVVQTNEPVHFNNDIPPGTNTAVLVLADGTRINLDNRANGELAKQENTTITKKEGQVQYNAGNSPLSDHITYNTITTARGNQYQIILPDGSKVWLNAESSVRFPVAFTGRERRVEITGEVFLEVIHNPKMPFTVLANGVEVHDLGTQFNVNAYDGNMQTTVVEGKVEVVKIQAASSRLQAASKVRQQAIPGEQVTVNSQGKLQLEKAADVDAAIAWKNGQFMFAGNSIQSVMRQLERWYDIEVSFAPNVSKEEYVGTITRFSNISAVLKMLERTGTVKFEVNGRKVVVK